MNRIRVVIADVDTSRWVRARRRFAETHDIEIVGCKPANLESLAVADELDYDVLLIAGKQLTDAMIQQLGAFKRVRPEIGVLVVARDDAEEMRRAEQCLQVGAYDIVEQPRGELDEAASEVLVRRLLPKLRSLSAMLYSRLAQGNLSTPPPSRPTATHYLSNGLPPASSRELEKHSWQSTAATPRKETPVELVVIGASTGGPEALTSLVADLSGQIASPILVVLHVPAIFANSLVTQLNKRSALEVMHARDGGELTAGRVYFSPGERHLVVGRGAGGVLISRLLDTPSENGSKPSVDVLFRSAEKTCGANVLGVLLTGMGQDGAAGAAVLHRAGAKIIVQDEESSIVWGMPGSAVRQKVVDEIVPLSQMASYIERAANRWKTGRG